jgi:hypothetical protein
VKERNIPTLGQWLGPDKPEQGNGDERKQPRGSCSDHDLFTRYCCALDNGEISKDGNHRSLPPGRYACELIKEDSGRWRFSRRTVFHDHDAPYWDGKRSRQKHV